MTSDTKLQFGSGVTFKLGVGFIAVLVLMSGLTWLVLIQNSETLKNTTAEGTIAVAWKSSFSLDRGILLKHYAIDLLSQDSELVDAVSQSNIDFGELPDLEAYIAEIDSEWHSVPFDETSELIQSIENNNLSKIIKERLVDKNLVERGYDVYNNVLITNMYGATIAMSSRVTEYLQDDEWWHATVENGSYISDMGYDDCSRTYGVSVCVRIEDSSGTMVGVMKGIVNLIGIVRETEIELTPSPYASRVIKAVTPDGRLLYSSDAYATLENISDKSYFVQLDGETGSFVTTEGGCDVLYSYATSPGYLNYGGFGWIILVGYNLNEVLAPAHELRNVAIQITAVLLALGGVVAYFSMRSVIRPIRLFTGAARDVSGGNLDRRVDIQFQRRDR